jgi:nucleoside-triphosphatase
MAPRAKSKQTIGQSPIVVLTGARLCGKTTTCRLIATAATRRGLVVAGVLSPAVFEDNTKTAIDAVDLYTGQWRRLASRGSSPGPGGLCYQFQPEALAWADEVIASSCPCDLLIIDELGPLELLSEKGFTSAFEVLRYGRYRLAIVVVRPELVRPFLQRIGREAEVRTLKETGWDWIVRGLQVIDPVLVDDLA